MRNMRLLAAIVLSVCACLTVWAFHTVRVMPSKEANYKIEAIGCRAFLDEFGTDGYRRLCDKLRKDSTGNIRNINIVIAYNDSTVVSAKFLHYPDSVFKDLLQDSLYVERFINRINQCDYLPGIVYPEDRSLGDSMSYQVLKNSDRFVFPISIPVPSYSGRKLYDMSPDSLEKIIQDYDSAVPLSLDSAYRLWKQKDKLQCEIKNF